MAVLGKTTATELEVSGASTLNTLLMKGLITFASTQTWPTFNQNTTGNAATATSSQKSYANAYCTCSTSASTSAKVVTSNGSISLVRGRTILMYNTYANTAKGDLTLNVDDTGAKSLVVNGARTTDTNSTTTMAVGYYTCTFDGTYWRAESNYEISRARYAAQVANNSLTPNSTWYNVPIMVGNNVYSNSNIQFYDQTNVTTQAYTYLKIGNGTAVNTSGNKAGRIRLYGTSAYYVELQGGNASANRTITFPNSGGTVALTSNLSSYLPLSGGTMTGQLGIKLATSGTDLNGIKLASSSVLTGLLNNVLLLGNNSLRFSDSSTWDYDNWAGLKYDNANKVVSLGIADGTVFSANTARNGGLLQLPGIDAFKSPKTIINPNGDKYSNSYNEGLRINRAENGWSVISLGGDSNSTSGTGDKIWLIGRRGVAGSDTGAIGDFTIENNGSSGKGLTLYANGNNPTWNKSKIVTESSGTASYANKLGSDTNYYTSEIFNRLFFQDKELKNFDWHEAYTKGDWVYCENYCWELSDSKKAHTDWVSGKSYVSGDGVLYNGKAYFCSKSHTSSDSILPTNSEYWISDAIGRFAQQFPVYLHVRESIRATNVSKRNSSYNDEFNVDFGPSASYNTPGCASNIYYNSNFHYNPSLDRLSVGSIKLGNVTIKFNSTTNSLDFNV